MLIVDSETPMNLLRPVRTTFTARRTPLSEGILLRVKCCREEKDCERSEKTSFSNIMASETGHLVAGIDLEKENTLVIAFGRMGSFREIKGKQKVPSDVTLVNNRTLIQRILRDVVNIYRSVPGRPSPDLKPVRAKHYCLEKNRSGVTQSRLPIPNAAIAFSNEVGPLSRISGLLAVYKEHAGFDYIHLGEGNVWLTEEQDGLVYDFCHHVFVKVEPDRSIELSRPAALFLNRFYLPSTIGGIANLLLHRDKSWVNICDQAVLGEFKAISTNESLRRPDPREEQTQPRIRRDSILPK